MFLIVSKPRNYEKFLCQSLQMSRWVDSEQPHLGHVHEPTPVIKGVGSLLGQARAFCPIPWVQSVSFKPKGECSFTTEDGKKTTQNFPDVPTARCYVEIS